MLEDFLREAEILRGEYDSIQGVGVSVGGPLDPVRGIIYSPPHLPGWDAFPLGELLSEKLGLPVVVEHDAVACLLAECLWGGARYFTHAVYLTAGTGCGAGALVDGRVLRGPGGHTTEIGHLRLTDDGPEVYGKKGSVEAYCSGTGIALLAPAMYPDHFRKPIPLKELVRLTAQGDHLARRVLQKSAWGMGRACALISDLFAPQVIIIGSLASYMPDWWMEEVRAEWRSETLPDHAIAEIRGTSLREKLQDLSPVAACVFNGSPLQAIESL